MFSTKYPNNIRTVSGVVILRNDDVTLECDTTLGPVVINLSAIPANYWNTLWKLYIVDKSNNASVNNITINAGVSQTINGAASTIIAVNGGCAEITVMDNANYLGSFNYSASTTSGHIIANQGVNLPNQPILNFIGAVVASNGVGQTIVNIGGLLSVTNAQLIALIAANTVVVSQNYLVTDAQFSDVGVVVQGASSNTVTVGGYGFFLNADYLKVGNYSGVPGFGVALGLWSILAKPVAIGDCVVWNNFNYKNLTGVWGTAPDTDLVNWVVLAKSTTTGYIAAVDVIKYNVKLNYVVYRADNLENEVDLTVSGPNNSLLMFQWGRDSNCYGNKVLAGSFMICTNSYATFSNNSLTSGSVMTDATSEKDAGEVRNNILESSARLILGEMKGKANKNYIAQTSDAFPSEINAPSIVVGGELRNNRVTNGSIIKINTLSGTVDSCNLESRGQMSLGSIDGLVLKNNLSNQGVLNVTSTTIGVDITGCEVSDENTVDLGILTISQVNSKIRKGFSNWLTTLDCSDPAIYDLPTLTLTIPPLGTNFFGLVKLINCTGLVIKKIINISNNHITRFIPNDTFSVGFQHTVYSAAVPADLLCDAPSSLNTLVGRSSGSDFIEYEVSGTMRMRYNLVLIAP
jgi:hypothetical protein